MDFSCSTLTLEVDENIATLWLDRPEKMNAVSSQMWADFVTALEVVGNNDDIRALVIAGRGKSFCVGIDLGSFTNVLDLSQNL